MSRIQLEIQKETQQIPQLEKRRSKLNRSELFDFEKDNEEISASMVSQQIRDIS